MSEHFGLGRVWLLASCLLLIATPHPAQAQVPPGSLVGLLLDFANRSNQFVGLPDVGDANDPGIISLLSGLAALETSTAPLGTSSGGFTYTFDSRLGVWERSAYTFGPAFAERSLTIGRRKLSVGFNWLHASYDSAAGLDLHNGDLRTVKDTIGPEFLPDYSSLRMNLDSDIFVFFANYGVTDRLDVSVEIPVIRTSLDAQLGIFEGNFDITGGSLTIPETTTSGVGDIGLRGKYRIWPYEDGGLAALVEVHLPSGDRNSFRGLDVTRTLVSGIWSQGGRVSPHASVGYEFWSDSVSAGGDVFVKDQVKYAFGIEVGIGARATVLVDILGRYLRHGGRAGYQTVFDVFGPRTANQTLVAIDEGLHLMSLAPGMKWNVWRSVLVTGSILTSLQNEGLQARAIPVVGIDWTF